MCPTVKILIFPELEGGIEWAANCRVNTYLNVLRPTMWHTVLYECLFVFLPNFYIYHCNTKKVLTAIRTLSPQVLPNSQNLLFSTFLLEYL